MDRDEVSISPPLQIFRMLSFRLDAVQTANTAINTMNDFNLIITYLSLLKKYLILIAPNATGRKLLKTFENAFRQKQTIEQPYSAAPGIP